MLRNSWLMEWMQLKRKVRFLPESCGDTRPVGSGSARGATARRLHWRMIHSAPGLGGNACKHHRTLSGCTTQLYAMRSDARCNPDKNSHCVCLRGSCVCVSVRCCGSKRMFSFSKNTAKRLLRAEMFSSWCPFDLF